MKSQNIFERLAASGEQMKKYPKIPCPVCNVGVTEKFLNIHLDKCLKTDEDPSPIIRRTQSKSIANKKKKKSSVKEHLAKLVIDDTDDSEGPIAIDSSDFEEDDGSVDALENYNVHQNKDKEVKDDVDETVPPSSPTFDQYTDNMTQGSYLQSQAQ